MKACADGENRKKADAGRRIGLSRRFRKGWTAPICREALVFGVIFARKLIRNTGTALAAAREQHGIIRQSFARRFRPAAPGKRLVHALVIEFRPEELLERFDPPQPFQQLQNVLLSFGS